MHKPNAKVRAIAHTPVKVCEFTLIFHQQSVFFKSGATGALKLLFGANNAPDMPGLTKVAPMEPKKDGVVFYRQEAPSGAI